MAITDETDTSQRATFTVDDFTYGTQRDGPGALRP